MFYIHCFLYTCFLYTVSYTLFFTDVIYCNTLEMLHQVYNEMKQIIGLDEIIFSQHIPSPRLWNNKKTGKEM